MPRSPRPPRYSWICPDAFDRERLLDTHRRLMPFNVSTLATFSIPIGAVLVLEDVSTALWPTLIGLVMFSVAQRICLRFARPEVWMYWALIAAQALMVAALTLVGLADTPALVLGVWPLVGLVWRFRQLPAAVGSTVGILVMVAGAGVNAAPLSTDDIIMMLFLVTALVAITRLANLHGRSDLAQRGAAALDPLTGLLNRRALDRRVEELEAAMGQGHPGVGLLILDLDHFKRVNDEHGHEAGDTVLRELALRLRHVLGPNARAYRLGGEEFAVLLIADAPATVATAAEAVRASVTAEPLAGLAVTASVGTSWCSPDVPFDWSAIYHRADTALYAAKASGRNRVATGAPAAPEPTALAGVPLRRSA